MPENRTQMRRAGVSSRPGLLLAALVMAFISVASFLAEDAFALPMFSRQIGRDCTFCHVLFPKLNETGRIFRSNGYRLAGEGEWKEVKSITTIPVSFEVEVEGVYNKDTSSGVKSELSDLKVEEFEVFAGGAFGKTGRVSVLGVAAIEQTATGTDASINKAFIQINDIVGEKGEGLLNIRAGQWDMGLPFLSPTRPTIHNRYFAEKTLELLALEERAVEVNGSIVAEEESRLPTHRYSIGVSREDVSEDGRLKGYYAVYSAAFMEDYSIGAIYRGGKGGDDESFRKYGVAGEAEAGPFVFTLAYFKASADDTAERNNYMAEVLYFPFARMSLGARYDYLKESGGNSAKSQSYMARYNILSNVYAQAEYRGLEDDGFLTGSNDEEKRVRVFMVALF